MYSLANAAARNMKLSDSMTDLGTMVALAGALRNVDLDKMTFLQVPSRGGLGGSEAGRVEPIYDQAQLIFDRIANDQPIVIKKANTGYGASVKEETAAPEPDTVNTTGTPARRTPLASFTVAVNVLSVPSAPSPALMSLTTGVVAVTPAVVLPPVRVTVLTVTVPYVIVAVTGVPPPAVSAN